MGKSFFNYIQPTIVKLSEEEGLPSHLKGHYMVNLNVVGIPYFTENFLLIEDGKGGYMYMLTNEGHKIRISNNGMDGVIDVPRAYIVITKEFVESQDDFSSWILSSIADNSYFITGTDNFKPGRDYYINTVLADYLRDNEQSAVENADAIAELPVYLDGNFNITKWWTELDADTARYTDFEYFRQKNKIHDLHYSEEELQMLCHTFFAVLKDGAKADDDDMLKTSNRIYEMVMDYYYNYQTDCASAALSLILGSDVTQNSKDNCGCCNDGCTQTKSSCKSNGSLSPSCYDIYRTAMAEWLSKMLGDTEYYKDWMWKTAPDGSLYANEGLIQSLILLLEEFEMAAFDLSFSKKSIYNHTCTINEDTVNDENHNIIKQYIQVLKWVLSGCIDNNVNKIKVIGQKFGKLIPRLCL